MQRNGLLNNSVINLWFMLASQYGLKHLKESGCHKFF